MNINKKELKRVKKTLKSLKKQQKKAEQLNQMVGRKVIIRTYSAGVWFGMLDKKAKNEVIVSNARRLWRWHTKKSISLSSVAIHGINYDKSRIAEPVNLVWLEAIEIIKCTKEAVESIEGAEDAIAK